MSHPNAPLTPEGRRRLCQRVDAGRPICQVAAEAGVGPPDRGQVAHPLVGRGRGRLDRPVLPPGRLTEADDREIEDLVEWLPMAQSSGR